MTTPMDLSRLTDRARKVLALAHQEAQRFDHDGIGTEHLLLGLVKEGSGVGANVLKNFDIDLRKVRTQVESLVKPGDSAYLLHKLPYREDLKVAIASATAEAKRLNHAYVGTEHLLLGLVANAESPGGRALTGLGLTLVQVREEVLNLLGADESTERKSSSVSGSNKTDRSKTPALDSFGRDLTAMAKKGLLTPLIGRRNELNRVMEVLCRRTVNSAMLIGESGVGKTAIIEGLAQRINIGDVPDVLVGRRLVALDLVRLVAGCKYRGQLEERMKAVIDELDRYHVILIIDNMEILIRLAAADIGDISTAFRPVLARDKMQCVVTVTLQEYTKLVSEDIALARRFQAIGIESPTTEQTIEILRGLKGHYEEHYRVAITDDAIAEAVRASADYRPDWHQPSNAMDLLDEAAVYVGMQSSALLKSKSEAAGGTSNAGEEPLKSSVTAESVRTTVERLTERGIGQVGGSAGSVGKRLGPGLPNFERLQVESILHGRGVELAPGTGFVLLPHNEVFQGVYDAAIKPAMEENGIVVRKADDISQPGAILAQVWEGLRTSEVLIADVSGANANVVFELGLCYGLQRCPVLIVQNPEDLPFNVRSLRYIEYGDTAAGIGQLKKRLSAAIKEFLAAARASPRPVSTLNLEGERKGWSLQGIGGGPDQVTRASVAEMAVVPELISRSRGISSSMEANDERLS